MPSRRWALVAGCAIVSALIRPCASAPSGVAPAHPKPAAERRGTKPGAREGLPASRPQTPPRSDDRAQPLADRIGRRRDLLFTFLNTPGAPQNNSHAERRIRPAVIIRKNSLCNPSRDTAATHAVPLGFYRTLKLRGLDATPTIADIADAIKTRLRTGTLPPLPPLPVEHASSG